MAHSDKNILITPNIGSTTADPKIVFSGADASTAAQNITLQVYPTNSGTLSFEGSAGQLFSITNSMTGTIYSVNDVSGIPSIEVLDTGLVKLAQYSGNVLLGTGTDDGIGKLQIRHTNLSAEPFSALTITNTNSATGNAYTGITLDAPFQTHYRYKINGALKWQTRVGNGNGTDDFRIYSWTAGGDTLIGTTAGNWTSSSSFTAPTLVSTVATGTAPLTVASTTLVTNLNADMVEGLHVHTGTNNEANKIVRTDANGYIQAGWINTTSGDNGTTAISRVYASSDGYIRYYSLANFGSQLTNLNASNLASGTVPTARLGTGTANSTTYLRGDNTWATVSGGATVSDDTTTNATRYIVWEDVTSGSSTTIGVSSTKLYFNPSTGVLNSTSFNSLSDENQKQNVTKIQNATGIINKIDGVEFDWRDNNKHSAGVIAQQLETILPWLVTTSEGGIKSVNYSGLIGYLIESVKELSAEVNQLKNK